MCSMVAVSVADNTETLSFPSDPKFIIENSFSRLEENNHTAWRRPGRNLLIDQCSIFISGVTVYIFQCTSRVTSCVRLVFIMFFVACRSRSGSISGYLRMPRVGKVQKDAQMHNAAGRTIPQSEFIARTS